MQVDWIDFDLKIFECVDSALTNLGLDQKELLRLRLKNRYYLPLKNSARAPVTLELALNEIVGPSVSEKIVQRILENISESFGIHIDSDSDLSSAFEIARKNFRLSCNPSNVAQNTVRGSHRKSKLGRPIHIFVRVSND